MVLLGEKKEIRQESGNLKEEIRELKKMIPDSDGIDVYATTTRACESFFTIYCC